jgi:predicted ABC-type ATPase
VSFAQETTLSGYKTERTVQEARDRGYRIRLYYIGLDTFDECLKRIKNRVAKGGHDIPADDVARRFAGRFDSLIKILPYCDEVTLFDNDNGFSEVAEYKNGEITAKGGRSPIWLQELIAALREQ